MKDNSDNPNQSKPAGSNIEEGFLLDERSIYIEGVKVLQKQERISHFLTLIISLVLVILLFVVLMIA